MRWLEDFLSILNLDVSLLPDYYPRLAYIDPKEGVSKIDTPSSLCIAETRLLYCAVDVVRRFTGRI